MEESMDKWKGHVAVVTGASDGIGAAIAEKLVENGMKVIGLAGRVERIEEHAAKLSGKSGELHGIKVDMKNSQEILNAFEEIEKSFGPIHVLVNSAGIVGNTTLADGDIQAWKDIFDVNVLGLCIATRAAIASMKKNIIDGHIIHINSIAGHRIPREEFTAMTESLRLELKGSKINMTSIGQGYVETNTIKSAGWDTNLDSIPALKSEDIAKTAICVLSTPSHFQVHAATILPMGVGP